MDTISDSVGLEATNEPTDARRVQALLNKNRYRIPDMRELREDGIMGPRSLEALRVFQASVLKFRTVDCLVDPDGKTWKGLVAGASGGRPTAIPAPPMEAPPLEKELSFPLRNRSVPDFRVPIKANEHIRYFGAPRHAKDGSHRAHAGVDLIGHPGVIVLSCDNGIVLRAEFGFFETTDALHVRHENGLEVRYGEIKIAPELVKKGSAIRRGQVLGAMAANKRGHAMLHIEFYAGTMEGRLSQLGNAFRRRGDLVNGTGYLERASSADA